MIRFLVSLGAIVLPTPVLACRLALLLALDVSSSVDAREYALQRDGLAAALRAPEVAEAFLAVPEPVALAAFEWSGPHSQTLVLPWTLITDHLELDAAAGRIAQAKRSNSGFQTALGHALAYASRYFGEAPTCHAKTLDVSGDGESNHGFPPHEAYRRFGLADVTVNALAIGPSVGLDNLTVYYRRELVQGTGAFVEVARGYRDFTRAMRLKLVREVSPLVVGLR